MATFTYKLKNGDTLDIGDSSNTVNIPGALKASGTTVKSYEKVTTTGSSDVVDPAVEVSILTSGGIHTVTLADGSVDGQIKTIILAVDGGDVTLTPANLADGTSLTLADAMDSVTLLWDGSNWNMIAASSIAIVA